jgi:hypothetical protein
MAQLRYNHISKTCARGVVTEFLTCENGTSDVSIIQAFKACLHVGGLSGETNIHNINTFIGAIDFLSCFVELRCRQATHLMYDNRIHQVIYTLDGITSHRVLKGSALVENVQSPSWRSAPCTKAYNKKGASPMSPEWGEHTATATSTNNNGHQSDKKNGRHRYDPTRNYKPVNGQAPVLPINRELESSKNWRSCKPMSQPQENIDETKEMSKPRKNICQTKESPKLSKIDWTKPAFQGSSFWRSPDPSTLPIPSFYKKPNPPTALKTDKDIKPTSMSDYDGNISDNSSPTYSSEGDTNASSIFDYDIKPTSMSDKNQDIIDKTDNPILPYRDEVYGIMEEILSALNWANVKEDERTPDVPP